MLRHRGLSLTLLVLLLAFPVSTLAQDWTFTRGDCGADGGQQLSDVLVLLNFLFLSGPTPLCRDACDANDNGVLGLTDALYMLNYQFSGGAPPPAPFTACGPDPTTDGLDCVGPVSGCPAGAPVLPIFEPPQPAPGSPFDHGAGGGDNLSHFHQGAMHGPERDAAFVLLETSGSPWPSRSSTDQVHYYNGEVTQQALDLRIRGRGLDFIWSRRYRSRVEGETALGFGWDHSYNICVEQAAGGLILQDGNNRVDFFEEQTDGTFVADGFFHAGSIDTTNRVTFVFGNHGEWRFRSFDELVAPGKIDEIVDRHGNTLSFFYDATGRLMQVTDTLGRTIDIGYDANDLITSVTDFTGRVVAYEYYDGIEPGGSLGDLKSSTTAAVTGTANGNDFPLGKTTTYTYSTGFGDARLNHNLLSVANPAGELTHEYTYHATLDSFSLNFDKIDSQILGQNPNAIWYRYVPLTPSSLNNDAVVRTIINDRRGTVREFSYDENNRCVLACDYTGLADPTQPTTAVDNRPGPPLRLLAPVYFETRVQWNDDFLPTEVQLSNGNVTTYSYEGDLDPLASRQERGNVRQVVHTPGTHTPPGAQSVRIEQYEYEPGFGGHCRAYFRSRKIDPRGNETTCDYDAVGNRLQTTHRIAASVEDWEYNAFGQCTAHTWPPNDGTAAPNRRRDEFEYHTAGSQAGYLSTVVFDFGLGGFGLTTTYSYDARGNCTSVVDPMGHDSQFVYNQRDQRMQMFSREVVTGGVRYETSYYYDVKDNLVRMCRDNRDEMGNFVPGNAYITMLIEYDILDRCTRVCRESGSFNVPLSPPQLDCSGLPTSEFITTEFEYDDNGNRSLVRSGMATSGAQPGNVVSYFYDERDLLFRSTRGSNSSQASTTQYDYDGNGNTTRVAVGLEGTTRQHFFEYDAYDRLVTTTNPMGNIRSYSYDPNGNLVEYRLDGELNDVLGSSANIRLEEIDYQYDAMDRLIVRDRHHFDPVTLAPIGDGFDTTSYSYFPDSSLSSQFDDNSNVTSWSYDTVRRRNVVVDTVGNMTFWQYDLNSNVVAILEVDDSELGVENFLTSFVYDNLDRCVIHVDNAGDLESFEYDSRNNLVVKIDGRGNLSRNRYDSADRLLEMEHFLTDTGDGTGAIVASTLQGYSYDAVGRTVATTDPNGNATQYEYDELNRLTTTIRPDGTVHTRSYDIHGNVVTTVDANDTTVFYNYDLANRETGRTISPGAMVSPSTLSEARSYDGRSLLASATNDLSSHSFVYDSLGNSTSETLNGQTTSRSFDSVGNQLALVYPGGRSLSYEYDGLNRVKNIYDTTLTTSGLLLDAYQYIGYRVLQRDCATNTRLTYEYDLDRRVSRTLHELNPGVPGSLVIDDRTYSWDAADNKTAVNVATPGFAQVRALEYDSLGRLVSAVESVAGAGVLRNTQYTYDAAGNRVSVVDGECSGPYVLDPTLPIPGDAQLNNYSSTGCDTRSYDENGNLISVIDPAGPSELYTYDYLNRLVNVSQPTVGLSHDYAYTATGLRFAKSVGSVTGSSQTLFFYDGTELIEEQDVAGGTQVTYVYGSAIGELLNRQQMVGVTPVDVYFRADDLQNIVVLCDNTGIAQERYEYGDFGTPSYFTGSGAPLPSSPSGNPYSYKSSRRDEESGLQHELGDSLGVGHYYDSAIGRGTHHGVGALLDVASTEVNPYSIGTANGGVWKTTNGGPSMSTAMKSWRVIGMDSKGSGMATGRRTYEPIVIRKRIDKSSPLQTHVHSVKAPGATPAFFAKKISGSVGKGGKNKPSGGPNGGGLHVQSEMPATTATIKRRQHGFFSVAHELGAAAEGGDHGRDILIGGFGGDHAHRAKSGEAHLDYLTITMNHAGDGVVDVADYAVWRDHAGGDGVVDAVDYAVWRSHFGGTADAADYAVWRDDLGTPSTDAADYTVWRDSLGTSTKNSDATDYTVWREGLGIQSGTSSGDGVVDAADYSVWRSNFGSSAAQGNPQHGPIKILKPIDKSRPLKRPGRTKYSNITLKRG